MRGLTRRETLSGVATLGTMGIAGCVADDGDSDGEDGADGLEITGRSIETTNVSEGAQHDQVDSIERADNTIVVAGQVPAPNPCHAATLEDASVDGGRLSLSVGVEDVSGDQGCIEVVATVEYEASIDVSDAASVEGVTVDHVDGETHEFSSDDFASASGGGTGGGGTDGGSTGSDGTDGGDDGGGDDGGGDATDSTGDIVVLESVIETTDTGPRNGDEVERAEISQSDSVITVTGSIPTSTPHYEATIESVEASGDTLSVSIGTRSTLGEDEAGTTVLGVVEYQAQFVLADAEREVCLEVTHVDTDSQFTCS